MKTRKARPWTSWIKTMLFCLMGLMLIIGCGGGGEGDDDGDVNQAPIAVLSASVVEGVAPLEVTFDGSASSDPDGDTLSFEWDFGDGDPTSTGSTAFHTFATTGQYTVVLAVTDPSGASDTADISITVSAAGPQQVTVPDVTGMTQSAAATAIVDAGLTVGTVTTANSDVVTAGSVISQDPVADASVDEGSSVDLVVSLGPAPVNVPDVSGMTEAATEAALVAVGLTKGAVTTATSDVVPNGSVISQNPLAGASVSPGSSVDLVISSGPAQVSVPEVTGQTQSNAQTAIEAAGLTVGMITSDYSDTVDAGLVISQNPATGTSVDAGSTVYIVVSLGPIGDPPPDPATVAPELDLTVATTLAVSTSFLYTGSTPIQTGMAADTIEAVRAAVIRGRVLDRNNDPLPGVIITILNHPEFGRTLSREADGMFDMAINGGGYLTINYEKSGYLPVQRQVDVPWQDYARAPDVVMIGLDSAVTPIDLTSPTIQVARGSLETDDDGTRQATLLFMPGTSAEMVLPDGSIQALTNLNMRATEYTVGDNGPEAMPAELPPSTAYTYAVELSADEANAANATRINFNQPVYTYLENFIGAPVGTAVPTGYYDRIQGQWIASENGRVIKVLDVSEGLALLDTNGDEATDDAGTLAELDITDGERETIGAIYIAGQTLWRVPIMHLTPYDCNWPYGPPPDAVGPNGRRPRSKGGGNPEDDPCTGSGSIIECQNQTLGERVSVIGTSYSLNYRSDRTMGRWAAFMIEIPVSGETLPASLNAIELEIHVAGRVFEESLPPDADQVYLFFWDGLNAYGRKLQGKQPITVYIRYQYPATYYAITSSFDNSFDRVQGASGAGGVTGGFGFIAREDSMRVDIERVWEGEIGGWQNLFAAEIGGWSLSAHHAYAPLSKTLYQGDGSKRSIANLNASMIINTLAGGGTSSDFDGTGLAVDAQLEDPMGVAMGPDGSMYLSDTYFHCVFKVAPDGYISRVAGRLQQRGFYGDGNAATDALLDAPSGIAIGRDNSIYIADTYNQRVRKVDPNGIITTIAGDGIQRFSGDGGPAAEASLWNPRDVALGPDNSVYIADKDNCRVRKIGGDGIITTVVGDGNFSYSGDGGLAVEASCVPFGIDIGSDGSLYIANYYYNRIRKVSPDGMIMTVAGGTNHGYNGDGIPAMDAYLDNPQDVVVGKNDNFFIADKDNDRIRRVDSNGIITTVAGNGSNGFSGDNGLATNATFVSVTRLAMDAKGHLYISDSATNRIRKIEPYFSGLSGDDIVIASKDGLSLFQFDAYGRHIRTLDTLNRSTIYTFGYDSEGRLIEIEDRYGQVTTIERDTDGAPTAIVAQFGERTELALNTNGYLASITNPAEEQTTMTYNDDGLLTSMTYPQGGTSQFTYDEDGLLTADEDPSGAVQTFSRNVDDTGYTVTRTTDMGRVTTFRMEDFSTGERSSRKDYPDGTWNEAIYHLDGSQTTTYCDGTVVWMKHGPDPRFGMQAPLLEALEITSPGGLVNSFEQIRSVVLEDPYVELSLLTLEDQVITNAGTYTYHYDAATRVFTETTPEGRVRQRTMDEQGRVAEIDMGADLDPVLITYDAMGRITQAGQGDQSWTYAYNKYRIISRLDALGNLMLFSYDDADRMTQMQLPEGQTIGYGYDANGNQTQVIMPSTAIHAMEYTQRNQLESYAPPGNAGLLHAYDADRARISTTLAGGRTITNTFDVEGRWTGIAYPSATVTFSYPEGCNRMASATHTPAGEGTAQTVTFAYDGSMLTGFSFSGAAMAEYSYTYGDSFLLAQIDFSSGSDADQILISRDNDGLVTAYGPFAFTRNGPDGTVSTISDEVLNISIVHDSLGRVRSRAFVVNGASIYSYELTRDSVAKINQKIETVSGASANYVYGYGDNIQIESVTVDDVLVESYTYDENGNRDTTLSETAIYDLQDRIVSLGATSYMFDADGYLTQRGDDNFTYSARGELLAVGMGDGTSITYAYDGLRRRVGRTQGSETWQYFYGNPNNLFQITAMRSPDGAMILLTYDESGFVFAMKRDGVRYYVATDPVGSPRVIADAAGTVVKIIAYDSFGRITSDSNPDFDMPIGFAGGLADPVSGLVLFGFRDYDPLAGRWTSRDPILFDGAQANLYVYVGNNPVGLRDPLGLWCIGVSGYAGIGGGAELCCNNGKCSICGELGLGLGVSGGVGSGDAKGTGGKVVSEAGASCGPAGASVKCEYGYKCGANCSAQAGVGPVSVDTSGDVKLGGSGGANKSLNARCSAQAKLVAEYCGQF